MLQLTLPLYMTIHFTHVNFKFTLHPNLKGRAKTVGLTFSLSCLFQGTSLPIAEPWGPRCLSLRKERRLPPMHLSAIKKGGGPPATRSDGEVSSWMKITSHLCDMCYFKFFSRLLCCFVPTPLLLQTWRTVKLVWSLNIVILYSR